MVSFQTKIVAKVMILAVLLIDPALSKRIDIERKAKTAGSYSSEGADKNLKKIKTTMASNDIEAKQEDDCVCEMGCSTACEHADVKPSAALEVSSDSSEGTDTHLKKIKTTMASNDIEAKQEDDCVCEMGCSTACEHADVKPSAALEASSDSSEGTDTHLKKIKATMASNDIEAKQEDDCVCEMGCSTACEHADVKPSAALEASSDSEGTDTHLKKIKTTMASNDIEAKQEDDCVCEMGCSTAC